LSNIRKKVGKVDTGSLNRGARVIGGHQISGIGGIAQIKWTGEAKENPYQIYAWDPGALCPD
jgi:hypothetical protein